MRNMRRGGAFAVAAVGGGLTTGARERQATWKVMLQAKFIAVLTLVFAAGCAAAGDRSEQDSVGAGAVSSTTSSAAMNTSSSIASPEEAATLPSADSDETDTQEEVSEVTVSTASMSLPETTTTTTTAVPFAEQKATSELTANTVSLIDAAAVSCSEPLEFECSEAVWEVCEETEEFVSSLREREESREGNEGIYDASSLVCRSASNAQLSEFATVLSAKYGIKFYEGYFQSLRNTDNLISLQLSLDELSDSGQEKYPSISTDTKEILMPLFEKILEFHLSSTYRIAPKDDYANQNILTSFSIAGEAIDNAFCPSAVALFIADDDEWLNRANDCMNTLCFSEERGMNRICFSKPERGLSSMDTANIALYWNIIPSICANIELPVNSYSPDDQCRQFADYICDIFSSELRDPDVPVLSNQLAKIKSASCGLGGPIRNIPRNEARWTCLSAIRNVRISKDRVFEKNEDCSNASKNCVLRSPITADKEMCEALDDIYEQEVLWRNLPTICADQALESVDFSDSLCFSAIEEVCNSDTVSSHRLPDSELATRPSQDLKRRDKNFAQGSCPIVYPWNWDVNISISSILQNISGPPALAPILRREKVSSNLSQDNYETLTSAINACSNTLLMPFESNCSSAVWNACYDLEFEKATYENWLIENATSEVSRVAYYICSVAYFAEVGEMIEAISLSYGDAYFANNFAIFIRNIFDMIRYEYNLTLTERLYMKPSSQENLSEETREYLAAFGDSLSAFFFHYIEQDLLPDSSKVRRGTACLFCATSMV